MLISLLLIFSLLDSYSQLPSSSKVNLEFVSHSRKISIILTNDEIVNVNEEDAKKSMLGDDLLKLEHSTKIIIKSAFYSIDLKKKFNLKGSNFTTQIPVNKTNFLKVGSLKIEDITCSIIGTEIQLNIDYVNQVNNSPMRISYFITLDGKFLRSKKQKGQLRH